MRWILYSAIVIFYFIDHLRKLANKPKQMVYYFRTVWNDLIFNVKIDLQMHFFF